MSINWKTANDGQKWVPVLNAAEEKYGLPHDFLARQCFEECSYDPEIIDGDRHSSAGAVGIMQLEPADFPDAGIDPVKDIDTGAAYMAKLYSRFKDYQLALAAYDWGPGNLHRWIECGGHLPTETQNYVEQIVADVPVAGSIIPIEVNNG